MTGNTEQVTPQYRRLMSGPLTLLAVVIVLRFALEATGVSLQTTRFLSASVVSALAIVYLGAVAPLRGITRFRQLALPAFVLSAWLGGWTALTLIVSGVFQLPGSHFAHAAPGPRYPKFWFHVLEHIAVIPFASFATTGVMAIPYFLHRWPVTVAPATVLSGLVILRFAAEAMNLAPTTASALSSSVGLLLSAVYLGGSGPRVGLLSPRQFLAPAQALGWVWRLWILLAALASAALGYETHFYDPSQFHLARFIAVEVILLGFAAGLLAWTIAVWVSRATRPMGEAWFSLARVDSIGG
jgi:hypothetical protein